MVTAPGVLKAYSKIKDLYSDEPPSALRACKKVIADPRTHQIEAYFTVFPEALRDPFERFIEREGRADIALDRKVTLEDWMYELQENGEPTFNLYHLSDVFGPCSISCMVINGMQGFVMGNPLETEPCVKYHRRSLCGAGDLIGALRPYFVGISPISRKG